MENNYRWEAEKADGEIMETGGDLTGCARFSLIPRIGVNLPQHDLVGICFKRRFNRVIQKNVLGADKHMIVLHVIVAEGFRLYVSDSTGSVAVTPEDYEVYV